MTRSGCTRLKETGQPGQRAGRTDADDDGVHIMLSLRPDLRRGAAFVGQRVGRVVELIGEEGVGNFLRQPRRNVLVVIGMALADVGAGDVHLGAHRLEVQDLLGGHLVRHHQHHSVTLGTADQGQAQAGVAGGGLDDGAAGSQAAIALGGVDHRQADAILDRTAGVLRFELEEQRARAGIETADAHQRRIADQFEYGGAGVGGHVVTSLRKSALDGQQPAASHRAPVAAKYRLDHRPGWRHPQPCTASR